MKSLNPLLLTLVLASTAGHADRPSVHGMVLFGQNTTYASHLPMFHSPHDYQAIFKISLQAQHAYQNTVTVYQRLKGQEKLFTLEPELMDLTQVIGGEKKTFIANLYQGHFEQGGQNLGPVQVTVEKGVFSAKLDPAQNPLPTADYFIFGEKGEYFGAHLIHEKPSFDEIVKVSQPYKIVQHLCRTPACSEPVVTKLSDSEVPLTISADKGTGLPQAGTTLGVFGGAFVDLEQVLYSNESDLSE